LNNLQGTAIFPALADNPETRCAVVMMGPPGGGKTTLARALAAKGPFVTAEPGTLLEREIRDATSLGTQIKDYKLAGALVPAEIVKRVIGVALKKADRKNVLFDGFPRSIEQIDMLFQLLKEHELELCGVLIVDIEQQLALQRITGRRVCSKCGTVYNVYTQPPKQPDVCERCSSKLIQRQDDREETVRNRLATYDRETRPAIEYFRKNSPNLIWEESASGTPDQLLDRVWKRLQAFPPKLT
jgi:adenylate kinase